MITLQTVLYTHQKTTGTFKDRLIDKFGYKESSLVNAGGSDKLSGFDDLEVYIVVYVPKLQGMDFDFTAKTYYGGQIQVIKHINALFEKHNLPLPFFQTKPEGEVEPPTREELASLLGIKNPEVLKTPIGKLK